MIENFLPDPIDDAHRRATWATYEMTARRWLTVLHQQGDTQAAAALARIVREDLRDGEWPASYLPADLRGSHELLLIDASAMTGVPWHVEQTPDDVSGITDPKPDDEIPPPPPWPGYDR